MIRYAIQIALLGLVAVYAFRRGGGTERAVAAILVGWSFLMTILFFAQSGPTRYLDIEWIRFAGDVTALAVFVGIALSAERLWTIPLASAQLLAASGHIARFFDAEMPPLVYACLEQAPFWLQIALLAFGIWSFDKMSNRSFPSGGALP